MTRFRATLFVVTIFALGLGVGVWVQHRWPLGRMRDEFTTRPTPTAITPREIASLPRERRLVIVCAGQSNAANYGETRRAAGAGVFAFSAGKLFQAADPLPGGDAYGGSVWTRLGARLIALGRYEAVVLAVAAQGSTTAADWAPNGRCHGQLVTTLQNLATAGLSTDFILWQQGEEEGRVPHASGQAYGQNLAAIQAVCRKFAPQAAFLVARATYGENVALNEQIRLAQAAASMGGARGPDLDQLGAGFRRDGVHFNAKGLDAAADLWLEALRSPLDLHGQGTR